jgi:hypothetical protein
VSLWSASSRARGALSRGTTPGALAFAGYLAFALAVTWPWVTDPGGILYGVIGSDLTSGVSGYQQFAHEHQPPFLPGEIKALNAPEGVQTDWVVFLAAFGSSATLWLLSLAIGSVAAHGLLAVLGLTLSAFAMFLLARSLTGHAGAAFVAGLAFGFWPFMYGTGWTWPHYIQLWVFVLLAWRMLVVTEKPTLRNGVLAGAAAVFAMTWIQYNLLLAGVVFATLALLALARAALTGDLRRQVGAQAAAAAVVIVAIGVLLGAARTSGYAGLPTRSEAQAVASSARLEMYVVPGPRHPLLGDRTAPWLFERFAGPIADPPPGQAIYAEIYLGVPLLLLAFGGAAWTVARVVRSPRTAIGSGAVAAGITALVLGLVGLAFSAPPHIDLLGVSVPTPTALVQQFTPVFRVAHRFAIVVMLAACLLAALWLSVLLRGRAAAFQLTALAALAVVFAVDLRAQPSPRTTRIEDPPIYRLLARQPHGIVAEYPLNLEPTVKSVQAFYQQIHEHDLFAGAPTNSVDESRKLELKYLLAKRTVPDLADHGVTYVVAHHSAADAETRPRQAIRGLRVIGGDASATLYRIVARPARFTSYGVRGFFLTEGNPPGMRWVSHGAQLELRGHCDPCVGTVSFPAASFARPRFLAVRDPRGRRVYFGRVETIASRVRFRIRFSRHTVLSLATDPPPLPINREIGGPDFREVGISLNQPVSFTADPQGGHRPLP